MNTFEISAENIETLVTFGKAFCNRDKNKFDYILYSINEDVMTAQCLNGYSLVKIFVPVLNAKSDTPEKICGFLSIPRKPEKSDTWFEISDNKEETTFKSSSGTYSVKKEAFNSEESFKSDYLFKEPEKAVAYFSRDLLLAALKAFPKKSVVKIALGEDELKPITISTARDTAVNASSIVLPCRVQHKESEAK